MSDMIHILIIGDVVGRPGRNVLRRHLPILVKQHAVDFVVANGENLAAGFGCTKKTATELFSYGVHALTSGNHCWDQKEIIEYMNNDERMVRPLNFSANAPGRGWSVLHTARGHRIAVINLIGQVFMGVWHCPFAAVRDILPDIEAEQVDAILVDIHAEASSEKMAMSWFLDGQVSFVYGTHTHVPTCDELIRPQGTGYQTDVGMTGCYDSVIGMKPESSLRRQVDKMPSRLEVVRKAGDVFATLVHINVDTRRTEHIQRIHVPAHS
ncbi:MAG: TIGR00282 family metallophosphoesterase [Mariprofundales bacterium]